MNKKCVKSVFSKLSDHARQFSVPADPLLPYTCCPSSWSVAKCHWLFTGACLTQIQPAIPGLIESGHVEPRHITSKRDASVLMNTFAPPYSDTTLVKFCQVPPA
jgi:hypothetical protein